MPSLSRCVSLRTPWKPRLEQLEDRRTPAIAVSFASSTLSLTSNDVGGVVKVLANIDGKIAVTTGDATTIYDGVEQIAVDLSGGTTNAVYMDLTNNNDMDIHLVGGNGSDTVGIGIGSSYSGHPHVVTADLGGGDNTFTYRALNTDAADRLDLSYAGGSGADVVTYRLGNLTSEATLNTHTRLGDGLNTFQVTTGVIGARAALQIDLVGGDAIDAVNIVVGSQLHNSKVGVNGDLRAGNDTFRVAASYLFLGASLDLHVDTGADADRVFLGFDGLAVNTKVNIDFQLGDGDDRITFAYPKLAAESAKINFALDGGLGFDRSSRFGQLSEKNAVVFSNTIEA